jgi:hypothetical protein
MLGVRIAINAWVNILNLFRMLQITVSTIKYLVELRGWNGIALQAVHSRDAKIYIDDPSPWILGLVTEARYSHTRKSAAHWRAIHSQTAARLWTGAPCSRACSPLTAPPPRILKAATHNWERQRCSDARLKGGVVASQPRLSTFQHHPLLFQAARWPSRPPPITTRATRSPVDTRICLVI